MAWAVPAATAFDISEAALSANTDGALVEPQAMILRAKKLMAWRWEAGSEMFVARANSSDRTFSNSGLLRSVMNTPSRLAFISAPKNKRYASLSREWMLAASVPVIGARSTAKIRERRGRSSISIVSNALF